MNLGIILMVLIGAGVVYLLVFHAPASDWLCSSEMITELEDLQRYLADQGILTYIKSAHIHSLQLPVESTHRSPSLHVQDVRQLPRAAALLRELEH